MNLIVKMKIFDIIDLDRFEFDEVKKWKHLCRKK